MRLTLNLDTGSIQASPAEIEPPALVRATLGDSPFDLRLVSNKALLTPLITNGVLIAAARIEFVAKPETTAHFADVEADPLVEGAVDISVAPNGFQLTSLSEDWHTDDLVTAFDGGKTAVPLWGQYRWRQGAQPIAGWSYGRFFPIELQNSLFPDVLVPPGAVPAPSGEWYFKPTVIDSYIGTDKSLDALPGGGFANGDLVKAVIGGDLSFWNVIKPATEVTSVDDGLIRLTDDSAHLERVAGL